jgi:16S rRNA (uracil1498-N3)-methyltransferase
MRPRFFAPDAVPGLSVILPDDEAHHLVRVLRTPRGAFVTVFDGRGAEYLARVETESRRDARLRIVARTEPAPELAVSLTLAQALLKGHNMEDVVRDATMLGVAAVQPVRAERSNVSRQSRNGTERWKRIALSAAKQCGRAVVPEIRPVVELETFLQNEKADWRLMLVEPSAGGRGIAKMSDVRERARPASCTLVIGPEGGWSQEEIAAARGAGFVPLTLGRRTWRADAVPVAAVAALQLLWGEI